MRKNKSRKYTLTITMCAILITMSLFYSEIVPALILCALAALVACVWIVCEARVDRAAAPLNLPAEPVRRVYKPPERARK